MVRRVSGTGPPCGGRGLLRRLGHPATVMNAGGWSSPRSPGRRGWLRRKPTWPHGSPERPIWRLRPRQAPAGRPVAGVPLHVVRCRLGLHQRRRGVNRHDLQPFRSWPDPAGTFLGTEAGERASPMRWPARRRRRAIVHMGAGSLQRRGCGAAAGRVPRSALGAVARAGAAGSVGSPVPAPTAASCSTSSTRRPLMRRVVRHRALGPVRVNGARRMGDGPRSGPAIGCGDELDQLCRAPSWLIPSRRHCAGYPWASPALTRCKPGQGSALRPSQRT